ncbi:transient receptor potential cation channel subfamily A member 1-like isoform X2 [Montipora foliosa]|uniref:transient receptor potential cation channel subfamily A member 1-like isoform X2 n=1 Tax=Montipora foliosa TaxID=591990 RepID=UPI0035F1B9C8
MSSLITDGLGSSDSPFLSRQATAASLLNVNIIDNNFELSPIDKYLAPLSARSQLARDILQDGRVAELKEFLLDSDNVKLLNSLDEEGASLLHFSARLNRAEATRVLIDRGADVDIRLRDGSTPLHVAARFNSASVAQVLLRSGANAQLLDALENNALHHAVRRRNKDVVDLLVGDSDIDINAKTQVGMTALHLVCMNGDLDICHVLLSYGADITAKTADCSTPLHTAMFSCNTHIAELLIREAASKLINVNDYLNEPDLDQDRALHVAAETGKAKSVELCLKHGADVNAQRVTLVTPLHIAATKGDLEIVKILCRNGADFHMRDTEKQTPLHRAASGNSVDVIKHLLSLGAEIDAKSDDNRTPFLMAVASGNVYTVRILLELGADVHACTKEMKTCLHLAVEKGHLEMVELLLGNAEVKENLYRSDALERVPLHNAAISPNIKILELLLAKYSRASFRDYNQRSPLHLAAQSGLVTHVEALGKGMSGLNERDDHGRTPIHLAAMKGNRKACQVLTRLGSDVNTRDSNRWTPLMWAARSGCEKTSLELLDKQAIIDLVNNRGDTALHISASYGKVKVVELLLSYGANVCIRNTLGQTCLDVAVQSGAGDVALAIARNKRWPEILEVRSPNQEPPMKILIEYFPEAASLVMDKCIQRSSHIQTDPNYTERYDFHLLDPGPDDESGADGKSFFGPTTMVKFHRESLLLHPLTQKLLDVKWTSFGIYIYYFNLSTYLVFLITHTIFVVTERDAQDFNPVKEEPNGTSRAVAPSDIFSKATEFNGVVLFLALIFAGANVAKEIFQLVLQKWDYFKDSSNMTEWALYLSTLCFMMPYMFTGEQLDSVFGDLKNPRNFWIPGIISIFLSYINAILFMRRFQTLGIYVNMFLEVTRTVARVMLVFFIFILAFSIVFYILFKEQEPFRSVGWSFVKVSVMMVGEFEYDDTFINTIKEDSEKTGNPLNPFPEISAVFIFFFLFMMSIILMNLLVGLAVGDIESVRRNATLERMAMQVAFVAEVENKYPRMLTRRIYKASIEIKPNVRQTKYGFHAWLWGQARFFDSTSSLTSREEMHEAIVNDIQRQISKTKKRVKTLVKNVELQNKLLLMIARKMDLDLEAEDLTARDWVNGETILRDEEENRDTEINGTEEVKL